jgi:hypothetical protein
MTAAKARPSGRRPGPKGWLADPDASMTATLGARMLRGEWVSTDDGAAVGAGATVVGQAVAALRRAGYDVEEDQPFGNRRKTYRVRPGSEPSANGHSIVGPVGASEMIHPPVGSKVTVRAVAMGARGALEVHLSDGNGHAWTATVTGYVGE